MSQIGLVFFALFLFVRPSERVTSIKEAIRLIPRDVVTMETHRVVTVTGVVTVPSGRTDGMLESFIQDRTAGIRLFQYDYKGPSLFVGDSVVATGRLGIYYGQEEIASPRIKLLRRRLKVVPVDASLKQVRDGKFHGMLVRCKGKVVLKTFKSDGISIVLVDGRNDTASAFADFREDPAFKAGSIHTGTWVVLTGVSTRFAYAKPYTGGNDILLRSSADIRAIPESFIRKDAGLFELICALILAVAAGLGVFVYLLRSKVKQRTKQLQDQARVLRLFFDSIAELTGVLNREKILELALKRGGALAGTTCVVFGEPVQSEGSFLLTAFEKKEEQVSMRTRKFPENALAGVFESLRDTDAVWNTTVDRLFPPGSAGNAGDSLSGFLRTHVHASSLTVTSPNPQAKDLLVLFDHTGPISKAFQRGLIHSYILHVYSAYRAAELFGVVKEQGAALETLYNNSVFGLLTISGKGTIRTANKIALQMFGDDHMIGKRVSEYLTPAEARRFEDLLAGVASASRDRFVRFSSHLGRSRGRASVEFAIQFDTGSQVFYATIQDTTDREYFEDYSTKEKKIQTLEKLASSLTHDLNNIVGTITGYASLLKRKLPGNSKEQHYADIIENSSRKTTELVKQVLGFAQLDAKTIEVVDLNKFVSDTAAEFVNSTGTKYSVHVAPNNKPLRARISTSQMKQVLLAVLTNAAESMDKGGVIKCSTKLERVPEPAPAYVGGGEYCCIEVEDEGTGMDETIKRRVFEPFFTTKRVKKYTGLSLSMAYNIVKHHRGSITVDSELGAGTKVRIFLPRHPDREVPAVNARRTSVSADRQRAKIMVVDDEEDVRRLAYDILTEHGYSVVTANDGKEALELLGYNPDVKLVVLDMVMPGMGGKDTCIEIKKRPEPPKVLICTGYSEMADLETVLGKEADGLLQKPYSTSEMAETVLGLLDA